MKSLNWKYLLVEVVFLVLGIFLALKIDQWAAEQKIEERRSLALQNIQEELKGNLEQLVSGGDNDSLMQLFADIFPLLSKENSEKSEYYLLDARPAELDNVKKRNPPSEFVRGYIKQDSIPLGKGRYRYRVRLDYELNTITLFDLAWESAKIGGLMEGLDFSCTRGLFLAYDLQNDYKKKQEDVGDFYCINYYGCLYVG